MSVEGDISINLRLENGQFTTSIAQSGKLLQELRTQLDRTADASEKTQRHFNSFSGHFKSFMMTVAATRFALMDIHQVFLKLPMAVVTASGEIERMTKLMSGLSKETDALKRKQEGIANTKFVFNLAQSAPFEVKALGDAFVKLKTAGLDPASGSMQTLVDSVARFGGSSEHLKRASVAIQQMVGKGVVSMEELRQQLGEAVPDAMQAMAIGTGMSMGNLVKQISKGTVEATSAIERMLSVMRVQNDGAALEMMDTWVGQLEKLKTNFMLLGNDIGKGGGFFGEMTKQLKILNDAFSDPQVKTFASELSVSLAEMVRGIASLARTVKEYSGEIILAGKALVAIWVGSKLVGALKGLGSAFGAFKATYVGGINDIIKKEGEKSAAVVGQSRRVVLEELAANNARARNNAAAAAAEIAANRTKHAALMTEAAQYWAQYDAAEKVAQTKRLANGKFASAAEVANQKALMVAYAERANAAEVMASRIRLAEAGLIAASRGAHAATMANIAAAKAQLTALGTASAATASKLGVLRGAVGLLGGPIGVITTLLGAGVFAWMEWGNAAGKAADKAMRALERVKAGYASLADVQTMANGIAGLETTIQNNRQRLAILPEALSGHIRERNRELQRQKAELKKNLDEAMRQGANSSVDNAVNLVSSRTESIIRDKKAAALKEHQAELAILADQLKNKKISQEKYDAEQSRIYADSAKKTASIRVAAYQAQIDVINKALKSLDDKTYKGKASPELARKSFNAQLLQQTEQLRLAQEELRTAADVGTNPVFVAGGNGKGTGSGPKLTAFQKALEDIREKIAGVNAELNKEGTGTVAKMLSGYESLLSNKKISTAEFEQLRKELQVLQEQKDALKFDGALDAVSERITNATAGIDSQLEGTTSTVGKLRAAVDELRNTPYLSDEQLSGIMRADAALANLQKRQDLLDAQNNQSKVDGLIKTMLGQIGDFRAALMTGSEAMHAAFTNDVDQMKLGIDSLVSNNKLTTDQLKTIWDSYYKWKDAREDKFLRDSETPMMRLAAEWDDTTTQMQNASARWLQSSSDALYNFVETGKLNFSELAASILKDIARIMMQKALAGIVRMAVGGWWGAASGATYGTNAFSEQSMMLASQEFANGGIMTEFGPVALKKYLNGGVANSPQLALFGEGDMAEAYVPLPDGRSIPVTMNIPQTAGAGGDSNVIISIVVNNDGTENSNSKGEEKDSYAKMADRVKVVVREELVAQKRPGGMLYK